MAALPDSSATATAAGVSIGSAIFALGMGLLWWLHHPFLLDDDRGIVSWVTVHAYPIHQEAVALVGGVACVVFGVLVGRSAWRLSSRWLMGRGGLGPQAATRLAELAFTSLGSAGLAIVCGLWSIGPLVALPVALAAGTLVAGFLSRNAKWFRDFLVAPPRRAGPSRCASVKRPASIAHRLFAVLIVPVLLYLLLYDTTGIFMTPIDALHEGERLAHITEMRHGGAPYRDFYVQHGLGQDVLKAWLADTVLDGTVAAQRLVERALRPLGGVALYLFGLAVFRSWVTALLLALAMTSGRLDVHDRLILGLLSVGALARGLLVARDGPNEAPAGHAVRARPPTPIWTAIAGALAALGFWYSTEIGLYAAVACGATLVVAGAFGAGRATGRWRPVFLFAGGFGLGAFPVLAVLTATGVLDDFVRNTWIQVSHQRIVWGLAYPSLAEALADVRSPSDALELLRSRTVRFYVPVGIVLAAAGMLTHLAVRGRLLRGQRGLVVVLVTSYAFLSLYTALGRSDNRHLMYASAPAYALLLLWLESAVMHARWNLRGAGRGLSPLLRTLPVALGCALVAVWWTDTHDAIDSHLDRAGRVLSGKAWPRAGRPRVWAPLGAMGGSPGQIAYLRRVTEAIEGATAPGEAFYDFTNQAVFFFLADRPSASRYVYVAYAATPDLEREVIAELEADETRLVLFRSGHGSDQLDGVPLERRHPLIDRYLRDHYVPAKRIGGTVLMQRR